MSFLVLGGLNFDIVSSLTSHVVFEHLVEALVSDHLQDQDDDEAKHDDGTDDAGSDGTTTTGLLLVSMGAGIGVSRLALLSFLFVKLSCNGSPFCVNLGNLSVDLKLDSVGFSLAKHADVSRYNYWDFSVGINTDNLFVND